MGLSSRTLMLLTRLCRPNCRLLSNHLHEPRCPALTIAKCPGRVAGVVLRSRPVSGTDHASFPQRRVGYMAVILISNRTPGIFVCLARWLRTCNP